MQFTNTSGVTSQTDTNQHNAGRELHARLRNDEQHTSTPGPAGVEGAGGAGGPDRRAGGRRRSLSTHKRQARTIGGAARPAGPGRGAGGRRQGLVGLRDRPLRAKLACGDLAGGPPPTGTHSGPAQQNKPRGGRAWPGFEIDHSERSSRVAISRAGRHPPAHTAARPNKTSHAAAGPGRALSRRAEHHQPRMPNWCGGHRGPGRGAGGRRPGLAGLRDRPLRAKLACGDLAGGTPPTGTNTQAQTLSHKYIGTTKPPGPTGGRAAHASGRYAAISEVFSASGCRWRPGARRPRRRGRPCRPRPTCPTYAGRTASSRRPRRRS